MNYGREIVERRQFGRHSPPPHALVHFPGQPPRYCFIRKLSADGALLQLEKPRWLPFWFRLVIDSLGVKTLCEVRHEFENRVGVMFVYESGLAKPLEPEDEQSSKQVDDNPHECRTLREVVMARRWLVSVRYAVDASSVR